MEVAQQLTVVQIQVLIMMFALDQDGRYHVLHDRVVDLLTLLDAYVGDILRGHFQGVEYIVAQALNERHDQGVLGRLLCLNNGLDLADPVR